MRSLTEVISESFIWGIGITRPQPGQKQRAAFYITALLLGAVLSVMGAFLFLLGRFR